MNKSTKWQECVFLDLIVKKVAAPKHRNSNSQATIITAQKEKGVTNVRNAQTVPPDCLTAPWALVATLKGKNLAVFQGVQTA